MKDAIKQAFEALDWHDTVVLSLTIDRTHPGERDELIIWMEWADGKRETVRFFDCYALSADMKFGVLGPDSIRAARCLDNAPELDEVCSGWSKVGVELRDLMCFEFVFNTTASQVRVYARSFTVEPWRALPPL